MQRYEHFLKWQKIFLGGGKKELNLGPSGQRRATSSSARGVQIPCAVVCLPSLTRQVAVAGLLVAFFPGESEAFVVVGVGGTLVDERLTEGKVLEVLDGLAGAVCDPAG